MDYNVMDVIAEAENLQQQDETKSDQEDAMSRGVYEFPDGGRYVGEWKEDGPQGHGVCTLPMDGGHFQGRWDSGMQCSGLFTWPSGQKYIGSWSNGMRHGQGKEIRHDETYYLGDFKDNQRGVYGILSLANGALYRGQWSDGLQDGVGVEIYSDKGVSCMLSCFTT
jgi:junctophilin